VYSTWYWSPNSCVRQAVSFWMEASAYFWSAACNALGSGGGIFGVGAAPARRRAAACSALCSSEIWAARGEGSPRELSGESSRERSRGPWATSLGLGKDQRAPTKHQAENTSKGCPKTHQSSR
jgi:hypothetical protein